jgi:hypothetical protein
VEEVFDSLEEVDWSDLGAVASASEGLLRTLATQRAMLDDLLRSFTQDSSLLSMCEHYDLLDKLVLYRGKRADFRLRLHLFLPGYFDRPHNHRWTYSSYILHGSYLHFLYGQDDGLTEEVEVSGLRPIMIHRQREGSSYTLHHSMVHSVLAEPFTASLILRGPSQKDRFLVMDRHKNTAWWQYGMTAEQPEEREKKVMRPERLAEVLNKLSDLGLTREVTLE